MDLFDVAKACVRRWVVFLPLVAVALIFSYRAYTGAQQPIYYGSTTVGLTVPSVSFTPQQPGEVRTNGLLNSGGLTLMSNLVAMGLSDNSAHEQILQQGGLPDYEARVFSTPGGQLPLVVIDVSNPDPDRVTATLKLAVEQAEVTLRNLQQSASIPDDQMLSTYVVVSPGDPIPATPSRLRSTVAIMVVGVGLSVLVTVLVDVFLVQRARRKAEGTASVASPPASRNGGSADGHAPSFAAPASSRGASDKP